MRLEEREVAGQQHLLDRQDEAERRRIQREASNAFADASRRPAPSRLVASTMYRSEPISGRQSPFYAGERYIADAELARRERLALATTRGARR